jgi:hypothetical protein
LKLQIVLGIVLVILLLIIGFISINSTINNTCSNGNLGGELNALKQVTLCSDSDGGLEVKIYGTTTGTLSNGRQGSLVDTCLSTTRISEGYCDGFLAKTIEGNCPNEPCKISRGCISGKCEYDIDISKDNLPCGDTVLLKKCYIGECKDIGIEPVLEPNYGERIGACAGKSEGDFCMGARFTGRCKYEFGTLICW